LAVAYPTTLPGQTAPVAVKGSGGAMVQASDPFGGPGSARPGSARPPAGKPLPNKEDDETKKNDKSKPETEKKSPEPKVIRRGDREVGQADPEELEASVGEDGKVAFQFRNQPWVDLIEWLAQIADQPLDWQELPSDRVNLSSPGRYTVAQTMDLFNRHLLARGYTLLELPGGITVAKTEGINPAMVPRVEIKQLSELMPHTFVRTSLELGWLSSEKLAEELKPMISSNGSLTALTTTNRIEAMDAAINLQQIAELLRQERDQSSQEALAPEFKLRHIAAEDAKRMLEQFLGVEKKQSTPLTPQQMQMMQQMRQRNGGQPVQQTKEPEISIVANTRLNSVLIRAPIDRIAVASEFIKRIDVPGEGLTSLADIESRVQVFRLYSIDPEKLIEIVSEMNVLEPSTHIRADEDNQALIVSGSAADRFIIGNLIKRLDGSGRSFEVLQLRRLDANEVAESIAFLMGTDKKDKDENSSRRYLYYGFGGQQEEEKQQDEFRVAANARFRQVLLWANESEMEQVRNLLIKLGELPPPGGSRQTVRRFEASPGPETYQYLLQLQRQWRQVSDSPLVIPDREQFVDPIDDPAATDDERSDERAPETKTEGESTNASSPNRPEFARSSSAGSESAAMLTATADANETPNNHSAGETDTGNDDQTIRSAADFDRLFGDRSSPPKDTAVNSNGDPDKRADSANEAVEIQLDANGNLILLSPNTKALDRLENLMLQVAPPKRPYHVFKIKHQSASYVRLNLVEYFEDSEDNDSEADDGFRWWYDMREPADDGPSGLGKSNQLRFVQDPDTNTIVVSGATASQLQTIDELIKLWDVAEPANKRSMRYTKLINIEYGRARDIAETVKEAYRDLLSSNDKTFAARGGGGGGGSPGAGGTQKSSGRSSGGSGLVDSENGKDGGDVDFSFKGKLSLGIDETGNTLLVSAEGEPLLELVAEMIRKLDLAAKPAGDMRILSLSGSSGGTSIENVLKAFGKVPAGNDASKPNTAPNTNPNAARPDNRR
jgi:type II secretory pathway component GspD/PulD (secretin)